MNMHGLATPLISIVNPAISGRLKQYVGYTTAADGRRMPVEDDSLKLEIQSQDLTQKDLQHLDALNVQGSTRVFYLYGSASALNRITKAGGDVITLDEEETAWLVTAVLEQWRDWVKVSVTQQKQ